MVKTFHTTQKDEGFFVGRRALGKLSIFLLLVWLFQISFVFVEDGEVARVLIVLVPSVIILGFSTVLYGLAKEDRLFFLSPLSIFLAYSSLVFGFGPLQTSLAPDSAQQIDLSIFGADEIDHARVAFLNTTGLLFTTLAAFVTLSWLSRRSGTRYKSSLVGHPSREEHSALGPLKISSKRLVMIGVTCLLVIFVIRLVRYGLGIKLQLPSFLGVLDDAGWLAALSFGVTAGRRVPGMLLATVITVCIEAFFGLLVGMRSEAITPVVLSVLGFYLGSRSRASLIYGFVFVILTMIFITPVTREVRNLTWGGVFEGSSVAAVQQAVLDQSQRDDIEIPATYALWSRINYSFWQAEMMRLYDNGSAGDTYRYIPWTFVPRFLAKDKPIFTIGTDIGYAVQGVRQSSSFTGTVYGEMYWNGGWSAVLISSIIYGSLLALISVLTLQLFLIGSASGLFLALNGLFYGFSVDQTFSVGAVGPAIIFLILCFLYRIFLWPGSRFGRIRHAELIGDR